jgi:hypothetical protein
MGACKVRAEPAAQPATSIEVGRFLLLLGVYGRGGEAKPMLVIFAIEPRSYRQAMGEALRSMRPHLEVVVLEPDTLEAGISRLEPHLVFANRPDASSPSLGHAWVEFRPYEEPPARVRLAGRRWELPEVGLDDLLSIVDRAEELSRTTRELGNC